MIEKELQQVTDFDWFLLSPKSKIMYFTSGGGRLPSFVANLGDDLFVLVDYFRELNKFDLNGNYIGERDSHADMARKGLFAYDRYSLHDLDDTVYQLAKTPSTTLNFDQLEDDIKEILLRVRVNFEPESIIDIKGLIE